MSGTAAHIVRLYVSVPPSQPPSRKSFAKNSSRIAARLAAKGSSAGSSAMCFGIGRVVASITLDEFDAAISCDPVDRRRDPDAVHEERRLLGHGLGGIIV